MDNKYTKELFQYKKRLTLALQTAKICVFEVDVVKQRYTYFENSEAIFGVSKEKIFSDLEAFVDLPPEEYKKAVTNYFVHPKDTDIVDNAFRNILLGKPYSYEARMRAANSEYTWCKIDVTPVANENNSISMIGIITNIQSLKNRLVELTREAELDTFTRLYSKKKFEELCNYIFKEHPYETSALIIFDLDRFKTINDTYGHHTGDNLLLSISNNIKNIFRQNDIIARFGGDEFIILMRDIPSKQAVIDKVKTLLDLKDNEFGITKSVGIAIYPNTADNYETLLQKADKALYEAKRTKNTFIIAK